MMEETLKKLRLFIASPSDMSPEHTILSDIVEELRPLAHHVGVMMECVDWYQAIPDLGRPEQVILEQLKPNSWDIFIGILWHRFGTPPNNIDFKTNKEYSSGTEEEFRKAYNLWEKHKRPHVMIYRCLRPIPPDQLDPDQLKLVNDFFKDFSAKEEHPGLYQTFDTIESFEKRLRDDLTRYLLEYSRKAKGRTISPKTIKSFVPNIPDTLPRRSPFFGRDREMEKVLNALSSDERGWGVVIDGIGGIGKTALAVEAAYKSKERGIFSAFIFLSSKSNRLEPSGIKVFGSTILSLDAFLTETARAMGKNKILKLGFDEKQKALLDALKGTSTLLVYDNLETLKSEEQGALADWLRHLPLGCKAILTSRRRGGEGALWIRLEKLDWDTARQIILNESKKDASLAEKLEYAGEARWQELYDETKGSPLALIHVLGLMRSRGTLTFDRALGMLRGNRKGNLHQFIFQEARKELVSNDIIVLRALSFFASPATFEILMSVTNISRSALEMSLDRLDALSLLDKLEGAERLSLHPLTRQYVRHELLFDKSIEYRMGMDFARFWIDYVKQYAVAKKNTNKAYKFLDSEWPNLDATTKWLLKVALFDKKHVNREAAELFIDLVRSLGYFLSSTGRTEQNIHLESSVYKLAKALNRSELAGRSAYYISRDFFYRYKMESAIIWAGKCEREWKKSDNKYSQADLLILKGNIALQKNQYNDANKYYNEANEVAQMLGDKKRCATIQNSLGKLYYSKKEYGIARQYYLDAFHLAQKTKDKNRQISYASNLGMLEIDQGNIDDAQKWYAEIALPMAKEMSGTSQLAGIQFGLATVMEHKGEFDTALRLATDAKQTYKTLQHPNLEKIQDLINRLLFEKGN